MNLENERTKLTPIQSRPEEVEIQTALTVLADRLHSQFVLLEFVHLGRSLFRVEPMLAELVQNLRLLLDRLLVKGDVVIVDVAIVVHALLEERR